ncbi:MAG: hypothetical protein PWQ10_659 [Patescibacteria group bacterium]|nr:hypothetical protein [Patescibacteria group bacterium]
MKLFRKLNLSSYTATKCKHRTKRKGNVSAFGETTSTTMPINEDDSVDYCLECIGKMAIRCAWCGKTIFIGDPVTLYIANKSNMPDYAMIYSESSTELSKVIGCLRPSCADTGGDISGFWMPSEDGKGHVHRIKSVYEIIL